MVIAYCLMDLEVHCQLLERASKTGEFEQMSTIRAKERGGRHSHLHLGEFELQEIKKTLTSDHGAIGQRWYGCLREHVDLIVREYDQ